MSQNFISHGFKTARSRPGLAALLYAMNLLVGIILTVPIYVVLVSVTGDSGFAPDLAQQFDITLWADIMEKAGPTFQALFVQLFWILPLYFLWKVAASVGVIHTLRSEGASSFWQGIGRYTGKAILLALVYLVPLIAVMIAVAVATFLLNTIWSGEVATFWIMVVFMPTAVVLGAALVDMMHDYARMELVIGEKSVMESWLSGIRWPFRHGGANTIYVVWFVIGAVILILPLTIDFRMGGLWLVFLIQQVLFFGRAAITVGWFSSEVSYFDAVQEQAAPLIAESETYAAPAT